VDDSGPDLIRDYLGTYEEWLRKPTKFKISGRRAEICFQDTSNTQG